MIKFDFELEEDCVEKVKELEDIFLKLQLSFGEDDGYYSALSSFIETIESNTCITINNSDILEELVDELILYFKNYSKDVKKYSQINFQDMTIVHSNFDYEEHLKTLLDNIIEPLSCLSKTISQLINSKDERVIERFYDDFYVEFQKEEYFYSMGTLDIEKLFNAEFYSDFSIEYGDNFTIFF